MITTVVKFVVLAFMSTVGLFFIRAANFTPWNVSGESTVAAIGGGMAIALFSYLGVESAAVAAAKVRDPDRNIPRATILGTIATAVVYMLSLTVVFGILPSSQLADVERAVLRRGQRHVRRHLGRQRHGRRGHHLRASGRSTAGP